MRRKIIIGNWKMNKDRKEAINYLMTLNKMLNRSHLLTDELDLALAPSYLCLIACKTYIARAGWFTRNSVSNIIISAQNCNSEPSGNYTGCVSYAQLKEEGINTSIVGHWEVRALEHPTEEDINKQVLALTNNGMNAILCVGDPKEVSDAHNSVSYILNQVEQDIKGVLIDNLPNVIIAYEPVYAIGQADPIAVGTVEAVIKEIRNKIKDLYNEAAANSIRIVYGGSINSANYNNYISSEQIDGLLIGRSSLDVTSFYDIAYGTSQIIAKNYPSLGNKYYVLKQKEIAATNKPLPDPRHHVKDLNAKEASPDPNAHLKQQPTSEQPNLSANATQDWASKWAKDWQDAKATGAPALQEAKEQERSKEWSEEWATTKASAIANEDWASKWAKNWQDAKATATNNQESALPDESNVGNK